MTPKEKAQELFNKYATHVVMWVGNINTTHQNCKQCTLIAVDEIIEVLIESIYIQMIDIKYWQEVKKEIELL
jgi:hypothetical protein